jgi:hypothetical protein
MFLVHLCGLPHPRFTVNRTGDIRAGSIAPMRVYTSADGGTSISPLAM